MCLWLRAALYELLFILFTPAPTTDLCLQQAGVIYYKKPPPTASYTSTYHRSTPHAFYPCSLYFTDSPCICPPPVSSYSLKEGTPGASYCLSCGKPATTHWIPVSGRFLQTPTTSWQLQTDMGKPISSAIFSFKSWSEATFWLNGTLAMSLLKNEQQ